MWRPWKARCRVWCLAIFPQSVMTTNPGSINASSSGFCGRCLALLKKKSLLHPQSFISIFHGMQIINCLDTYKFNFAGLFDFGRYSAPAGLGIARGVADGERMATCWQSSHINPLSSHTFQGYHHCERLMKHSLPNVCK